MFFAPASYAAAAAASAAPNAASTANSSARNSFVIIFLLQQILNCLREFQIFRAVGFVGFMTERRQLVILARRAAAFFLKVGRQQAVGPQFAQDRIDGSIGNWNVPGEIFGDLVAVAIPLFQQREHAKLQHPLFVLRVHDFPSFLLNTTTLHLVVENLSIPFDIKIRFSNRRI